MKIKAVALHPGQPPVLTEIDNHTLGDYYAVTGGYIEAVNHATGVTMYCNEDGLMLRLPPNPLATELFVETGVSIGGGTVLGGVVVVGWPDEEGDDTDVTDAFLQRVGLAAT